MRAAGEEAGSGKECHAYAMLLGDLVRLAERTAGMTSTYLYPGTTIPCLMMQFADGFQIDLAQRGLGHVTVLSPNSREMLELFGIGGSSLLWRGLVAVELLLRWLCENRPYEATPVRSTRRIRRI